MSGFANPSSMHTASSSGKDIAAYGPDSSRLHKCLLTSTQKNGRNGFFLSHDIYRQMTLFVCVSQQYIYMSDRKNGEQDVDSEHLPRTVAIQGNGFDGKPIEILLVRYIVGYDNNTIFRLSTESIDF